MKPDCVTLTGADDAVWPTALAALSGRYPCVEWALLYFPEKEGGQRNPSAAWREALLALGLPRVAAHLCGQEVFRELLSDRGARVRIADLQRYGRIQLNINATRDDFAPDEILRLYRKLHAAGLQLILQYHVRSEAVIERFLGTLDDAARQRVDVLFDASGGTGRSPSRWPAPHPLAHRSGYAGGLGPDVLEAELPRIAIAATQAPRPIWIDMETGLRTDGAFDLRKAQQVLELAAQAPSCTAGLDMVRPDAPGVTSSHMTTGAAF